MKLENHLKEISIQSERNKELYDTWIFLKAELSKILDNVSVYFPHFSLHDSSHSKTICSQIERLLGSERISLLSVSDTFAMLMVFYCHDLGMAISYKEVEKFFKSVDYKTCITQISRDNLNPLYGISKSLLQVDFNKPIPVNNYSKSLEIYNNVLQIIEYHFRNDHAKRSADKIKEFLIDRYQIDRTLGVRFVKFIARACELHQENFNNILNLPKITNGVADDYIHPRLIATVLCLGDLLDLDTDRFNKYLLESVTPLSNESELHLKKHESIQHFLVCPEGIEISADCDDRRVYRLIRSWVGWIEEIINFTALNWSNITPKQFGNAPVLLQKNLTFAGNKKWVEYSDLKFTISQKRAIELLQGANIYKSKYVFLREIIQNAVDASVLQLWREIIRENSSIKQTITLSDIDEKKVLNLAINLKIFTDNNKNVVIELLDKGCGISENDIRRIANVGNVKNEDKSQYTSTMPNWLKPSGAFGLGLQSIFLVANKFEIITKTEDELAKKVIFESSVDGNGYIEIEDYKGYFDRGSLIKIMINPDKITRYDLYCSKFNYATVEKHLLIIYRLFGEIDNDKPIMPYGFSRRLKAVDYIPVNIECIFSDNNKINKQLYGTLFNSDAMELCKGKLEYRFDELKFSYYDSETQCISNLQFLSFVDDGNTICSNNHDYIYNQSLFFKNEFVKEEIINNEFRRSKSRYNNFDFCINVLGSAADEMLTIDRRDVKKEYEYHILDKVNKCLYNSLKKLVDNLVENPKTDNVSSIIIKVFEEVNLLNYRVQEFYDCYKGLMKNYAFGNYLSIDTNIDFINYNKKFDFEFLYNNNLVFVIKEIESDCFSEKNTDEIIKLDNKEKFIWLQPEKVKRSGEKQKTCLTHKAERGFISCINGKYYFCIEAKPLMSSEILNSYEKDNFYILSDFLCALFYNLRVMPSNKKYINISVVSDQFGSEKGEYVIELIINESQRQKLKEYFLFKNDISFNREEFIKSIKNDNNYLKTIEYISKENNTSFEVVDKDYLLFISDISNLIENREKYKKFISVLLTEFNSSPRSPFVIESKIEEAIKYNDYLV